MNYMAYFNDSVDVGATLVVALFDCHAGKGTHKGYPYGSWLFKMLYDLDKKLHVF